jgi:hypothetical protein
VPNPTTFQPTLSAYAHSPAPTAAPPPTHRCALTRHYALARRCARLPATAHPHTGARHRPPSLRGSHRSEEDRRTEEDHQPRGRHSGAPCTQQVLLARPLPPPVEPFTHFEPTCFTCAMHVRYLGSELSLFGQPQSNRESVLMTRHLVWTQLKFWWHNPDLLRCTISDVQSENSGVMLLKFYPDPN